jgi:hypothetical protein
MSYKFLHKKDLPFLFEAHTLAISSPQHFATRFAEIETVEINDPNEGQAIGFHDPVVLAKVGDEDVNYFRKLGINLTSGSERGTLSGNKVVNQYPPCFIFSTSRGFFPDIKTALTSHPVYYDACVKIRRPRELIRQIFRFGRIGDRPFNLLFQDAEYRPVQYGSILYKVGTDPQLKPDIFRKQLKYAPQNEWRIVFYPRHSIAEQRLIVTLDNLTDFIGMHPL